MGDDDWTALCGLGLRSAEALKDIAFAVTEKKAELQTERIEATVTCRIWKKEHENRNLQIMTEDVMEDGDGRLSLENELRSAEL